MGDASMQASTEREDTGDANHEEETREDDIRHGAAVPTGVGEDWVGVGAVSAGVYQDHDRDGDPP